jgi:hypothetical protein
MNKVLLTLLFLIIFSPLAFAGNTPLAEGPGDKNPVVKSYPNPVATDLTIDIQLLANNFSKVEVKIVNLLGQEITPIFKADLDGLSNSFKIDMREVPNGIYFMEVTTAADDGSTYTYTKKVTKI